MLNSPHLLASPNSFIKTTERDHLYLFAERLRRTGHRVEVTL